MNEEQLRQAYRRAMEAGRPRDRSACPPAEALAAVLQGTASEAKRLTTLGHVGGCAACRKDFEMLRTAGDVATRVMRPWWASRPVLALAAALVLAVGGVALWQRSGVGPDGGDILRNGRVAAVTLLAPREGDAVTIPMHLVWAAVPGARRYNVEILDARGQPAFTTATTDTAIDVPPTTVFGAGESYGWWVRAVLSDGTEARSTIRRLRISTP